jgi:preprotein translocase subunit YajC
VSPEQWRALLPIVVLILAFWFLFIRPARKRQQQVQRLQSSISVGDRVMLTSGIFGQVVELDDETLELEVAPGVVISALRHAVARVVEPQPGPPDEAAGPGTGERSATADSADGRDAPA